MYRVIPSNVVNQYRKRYLDWWEVKPTETADGKYVIPESVVIELKENIRNLVADPQTIDIACNYLEGLPVKTKAEVQWIKHDNEGNIIN